MNAPVSSAQLSAVHTESVSPTAHVDAPMVLQVQAAVLSQAAFSGAAAALANELASLSGAARACVGLLDGAGAVVVAMSGEVDFQRNAELCRLVAAAMDEAIEQGVSIVYPAPADARPRITLAHSEAARRGVAHVVTIPLVSAARLVGAVTLEFHAGTAPAADTVRSLEHLVSLIAPVLDLKRQATQTWHGRLWLAVRDMGRGIVGPEHGLLKIGALLLAAGLVALASWPVQYRVSAPARLEGAIQRALVAPADGFLREVHVRPGDTVQAGQVLAELDDQDLELERRTWASELAQQQNTYRAALAKNDRTAYVVHVGKADAARAQVELVEQQIARGRLLAPFDGIVIKGDLSQALGAPVQRGDVLLTIAPVDEFRLIVEVDERDIDQVRPGYQGALALAAWPDATFGFSVTRITPVATARDGRNFYDVEGGFDAAPLALRPGLQGVAKIAAGERTLLWVWTHRLVDGARLALWSLAG